MRISALVALLLALTAPGVQAESFCQREQDAARVFCELYLAAAVQRDQAMTEAAAVKAALAKAQAELQKKAEAPPEPPKP